MDAVDNNSVNKNDDNDYGDDDKDNDNNDNYNDNDNCRGILSLLQLSLLLPNFDGM